jgi:hypothetical protein
MSERRFTGLERKLADFVLNNLSRILFTAALLVLFVTFFIATPAVREHLKYWTGIGYEAPIVVEYPEDKIENGIHVMSGLVVDDGYELVVRHCGNCHSYKLVTQNRSDADGWHAIIDWMQETQNLWDLKQDETPLVNYLAKNYGPKKMGRRANLKNVVWYELD